MSLAWKELFPVLLATYRDGFVVSEKETAKDVKLTASKYRVVVAYIISKCYTFKRSNVLRVLLFHFLLS